ncbi:DUF1620 domain-containing protein [Colletotrichum truncatum]|uniref:DUF1620 domain-containing protein n=1 Tax=Colletotrichum truncatum TaxID=5467 RepID=A0ACC3Z9Y7_COLTU|nr:duf1620 domain-containing protein [Colletotrichum truncatum]KAF6796031.1 duf1620 domain-containing protein [Colletotrichum truncatum]
MVNSYRTIAGLAALSGIAQAKIYAVPEATTTFDLPLDRFNPHPTKAPAYAELKRRQATSGTTVLVAPDNTCGYISGRPGAAYTCGSVATCLFFTANRNNPGRVACCDSQECGARRTCYDQRQVSTLGLCNDGCLVDRFTLKCTNTARPYCNTISFPGSVFDYWCNTLEISTPQSAQTTYEGQTGRTWEPLALTDDASSSNARIVSTTSRISVSTTLPGPGPGPTTSVNPAPEEKSGAPVGAIVGGVVGGIAVIALIGIGIFLILRKKKQDPNQQQTPQQQPQMAQNGYPGPPQGPPGGSPTEYAGTTTHTQSVYDPKFAATSPTGYQQSFGNTPPPQGGFQQPGYFTAANMVPDRADTTSPGAVSQMTDHHRYSTPPPPGPQQPYQQQPPPPQQQQQQQQQQQFAAPPPTIHEAPTGNDGHRGQMHELA